MVRFWLLIAFDYCDFVNIAYHFSPFFPTYSSHYYEITICTTITIFPYSHSSINNNATGYLEILFLWGIYSYWYFFLPLLLIILMIIIDGIYNFRNWWRLLRCMISTAVTTGTTIITTVLPIRSPIIINVILLIITYHAFHTLTPASPPVNAEPVLKAEAVLQAAATAFEESDV